MEFKEKIPETKYNHPEIAEIEPAMISLIAKLKEKIDTDEYDHIISDDVGGRIPAGIIKKIITKVHPDKKISISHVFGGQEIMRTDQAKQIETFQKKIKPQIFGKSLLVTEFIHSGDSITKLAQMLDMAEIDCDLAILYAYESIGQGLKKKFPNKVFIGNDNPPHHKGRLHIHADSSRLTGIEKINDELGLYKDKITEKGKPWTREQADMFDEKYHELRAQGLSTKQIKNNKGLNALAEKFNAESKKISAQDLQKLCADIKKTHQDMDIMTENVVKNIWGSK